MKREFLKLTANKLPGGNPQNSRTSRGTGIIYK